MRRKKLSRKMRINNVGSFTVEATFVMVIIIGLVMALLFVALHCFDRINIECQIRNHIKSSIPEKSYKGVLGSGELKKKGELDFFCESYLLKYEVPFMYPLSQQYVENQFTKTDINIKLCKRVAADTVRMYDALRNEE